MGFVTSTSISARRRRRRRNLLLVAAGVLAAASAAVVVLALASGGDEPARNTSAGQTTSTAPAQSPTPEAAKPAELRVADLMQQLGCDGEVIGTQLYSRETGRCMLGKHELTVAVFESDQLRDQWTDAARQFGGNIAVGNGWAVWAESPDGAAAAAKKLNGQRG
ncbi:MAG TPA: hypothetical protein VF202_01005 [Trueperaceae bacterium]